MVVVDDVPSLEAAEEKSAFLFWNFGRNDTPATELPSADAEDTPAVRQTSAEAPAPSQAPAPAEPTLSASPAPQPNDVRDAIVEDADGTYHIADHLPPDGATLDAHFKELVDSVLG